MTFLWLHGNLSDFKNQSEINYDITYITRKTLYYKIKTHKSIKTLPLVI